MAYDLCKEYALLSPIYEFTARNGCFFCPNTHRNQLKNLRDNHNNLWIELLKMQGEPNKCSENKFRINKSLFDFEEEFKKEELYELEKKI